MPLRPANSGPRTRVPRRARLSGACAPNCTMLARMPVFPGCQLTAYGGELPHSPALRTGATRRQRCAVLRSPIWITTNHRGELMHSAGLEPALRLAFRVLRYTTCACCRSFPAVSVTLRSACLHRTVLAQWRVTACARSYPYFPRRQHTSLMASTGCALERRSGIEPDCVALGNPMRAGLLWYTALCHSPHDAGLSRPPARAPTKSASVGSHCEARELNP